ncbi:hypothetical protein [Microvirga sp. P5_D2]
MSSLNGRFCSAAQYPDEDCVDPEQAASCHYPRGVRIPSRERLRRPQACIPGQHGYLVDVMNTFVKNLRFFAHAGCLKAGK